MCSNRIFAPKWHCHFTLISLLLSRHQHVLCVATIQLCLCSKVMKCEYGIRLNCYFAKLLAALRSCIAKA